MADNTHVVKRKIENPLTGKEVERSAKVILPFPKELDEAMKEVTPESLLKILKDKAEDVVYWALYGLKIAAFNQVRNSLQGFDSDDEDLAALHDSFQNAVKSITSADPENGAMREAAVNFILSQPAYAELKPALEEFFASLKSGGELTVDFNTVDVKKPGKRGRQKKVETAETATSAQKEKPNKKKK